MKLHKKKFSKAVARKITPILSEVILRLKLTTLTRQLIAFLNYALGRGAGMGWALSAEVQVAVDSVDTEEPIVFDVGGNLGDWAQEFRARKSGGKIYIFEPQKTCQEKILEKGIRDSELICSAVGKEKAELVLYSSHETDGSASLHERNDSFFEESEYKEHKVEVISLDDFVFQRKIEQIDYIKFDIEGHELFALEGLQKTLAAGKVKAFSFEFGSGNLNSRSNFRDFWNLLHKNYRIFIITPSGRLEEIDSYYEDLEFYRGVSNFVAKLKL
jgi:FkbM family methyltransferase